MARRRNGRSGGKLVDTKDFGKKVGAEAVNTALTAGGLIVSSLVKPFVAGKVGQQVANGIHTGVGILAPAATGIEAVKSFFRGFAVDGVNGLAAPLVQNVLPSGGNSQGQFAGPRIEFQPQDVEVAEAPFQSLAGRRSEMAAPSEEYTALLEETPQLGRSMQPAAVSTPVPNNTRAAVLASVR